MVAAESLACVLASFLATSEIHLLAICEIHDLSLPCYIDMHGTGPDLASWLTGRLEASGQEHPVSNAMHLACRYSLLAVNEVAAGAVVLAVSQVAFVTL